MLAMSSRPSASPGGLSPREAFERFLDRRRSERTDSTIQTYHYRLRLFVEWLEAEQIETVDEIDGWILDSYEAHRSGQGLASVTLHGEQQTIKNWIQYLEQIGAVDQGLSEKVHVPDVPSGEESDDTQLLPADATPLLRHFRSTPAAYGSRRHVVLELLWFTGVRSGELQALDVRDYHADERYLDFVHRPKTGTPIKNGVDGQRPVAIPQEVCEIVDRYLTHFRRESRDEHDRQPLVTTRVGRITEATVRSDCYMATFPCHHSPCPHGKDPETCEYRARNQSSKCPSSRSPHQVRTGSIRWQLDIGLPPEVVSERVNASLSTIKQHYDKSTPRERMERRRRPHVDRMSIDGPAGQGETDPS